MVDIVSIIAASVRKDAEVIEQPLKRDGYTAGVMRTYAHKVRKYADKVRMDINSTSKRADNASKRPATVRKNAENSSQLADTPSDIPNIAGINSDVPS